MFFITCLSFLAASAHAWAEVCHHIFNGTSRRGEVLAVVLRFADSDAQIQQHLIQMMFLMKSLTGEETARELIHVLSVSLSPKQRLCGREQTARVWHCSARPGGRVGGWWCTRLWCSSVLWCLFSPMKVTRSHFLTIGQNIQQHQLLRVELVSVVDCGHPIVKATYWLEGDGPLIFQAYTVWRDCHHNLLA